MLVIDIAHGHSDLAIDALRALKKNFPDVDVIAGNVASAEVIKLPSPHTFTHAHSLHRAHEI